MGELPEIHGVLGRAQPHQGHQGNLQRSSMDKGRNLNSSLSQPVHYDIYTAFFFITLSWIKYLIYLLDLLIILYYNFTNCIVLDFPSIISVRSVRSELMLNQTLFYTILWFIFLSHLSMKNLRIQQKSILHHSISIHLLGNLFHASCTFLLTIMQSLSYSEKRKIICPFQIRQMP